jgi:hypothetical protein
MALVAHDGPALVQCTCPAKGKEYILSFGKTQYYVPESAIKSLPKKSNSVPNGKALGQILATKAPEKWLEYCSPECLCHIGAGDSSCVYTTFTVAGHDDESRFLRFVSGTIADRNFPIWAARVEQKMKMDPPEIVINNDRQRARVDVLKWTKANDCPKRAQLNPEMNQWQALDKEESVKSCRIEPEAKKRQLKAHGGALHGAIGKKSHKSVENLPLGAKSTQHLLQTEDVVEWELAYQMGPKGTYSVNEVGNVLRIVQYKHAEGVVNAAAGSACAAEEHADAQDGVSNGHNGNDEDEDEGEDNDL